MKRFEDIINEKINNFEYPYEDIAWKQFSRKLKIKKIFRTTILTTTIALFSTLVVIYFFSTTNNNTKQTSQPIINKNQITENKESTHSDFIINNTEKPVIEQNISDNKTTSNNNQEKLQENRFYSKNNEAIQSITPENNYQFSVSSSSTTGCTPHTFHFNINNDVHKEAIFYWEFGDGSFSYEKNPSYTYMKSGKYKVNLKIKLNEQDIFNKELFTIEVYPRPIAKMYFQQIGNTIKIENKSKQYSYIKWIYSDSTITENHWEFNINKSGIYTIKLIAENQYGCTDTISRNIDATYFMPIQIADAFTPDGDGINDLFGPQLLDYKNYTFIMSIYTKTGKCIFDSKGSPIWWDGNDNNTKQPCPADFYFYKIFATDKNGNKQEFTGKIKLIR